MKKTKNFISLMLALLLVFSSFEVSALAANTKSNLIFSVSSGRIQVGDKVTVIIQNKAMTVSSFTGGIAFDPGVFECTSIMKNNNRLSVISTVDEANKAGTVGFAIIGFFDTEYEGSTIAKVELTAKQEGNAEIILYEDSTGQDGYKSDSVDAVSVGVSEKHVLVKTEAKVATCTEAGYKEYWTCTKCGKLFSDSDGTNEIRSPEVTPALGHDYEEWVVTIPATCEVSGVETRMCSHDNSHTETRVIEAIGHDWGKWVVERAATEKEEGSEIRTCNNNANHIETRVIPKREHVHSLTKIDKLEATCETDGNNAYYICSGCNKWFEDAEASVEIVDKSIVVIRAIGHAYGKWVVTTPATCETDGVETQVCSHDNSHTKTRVIEAIGHDWGKWLVKKVATEKEEGIEIRVCKNDANHIETRVIPKLNHVHNLVKIDKVVATCEVDGNNAYYICSGCEKLFEDATASVEIIDKNTVVIPALGHAYGAWKITIPATCETDGEEVRICDRDDSHTETHVIEAIGHDWGEWVVTKAATEDEEGSEIRTCKNDANHIETRIIPKLGHIHKLNKINKTDATCEEEGNIEYYSCSECGKLFSDADGATEINVEDTVIVAVGHKWNEGIVSTAATCEIDGVRLYTCEHDANHTKTESIPSTNHDWGEWEVIKEATTTEDGIMKRICKNNASHKEIETIPATGKIDNEPSDSNGNEDVEAPDTGDSSMILWAVLMFVSFVGLCGALFANRKRWSVK